MKRDEGVVEEDLSELVRVEFDAVRRRGLVHNVGDRRTVALGDHGQFADRVDDASRHLAEHGRAPVKQGEDGWRIESEFSRHGNLNELDDLPEILVSESRAGREDAVVLREHHVEERREGRRSRRRGDVRNLDQLHHRSRRVVHEDVRRGRVHGVRRRAYGGRRDRFARALDDFRELLEKQSRRTGDVGDVDVECFFPVQADEEVADGERERARDVRRGEGDVPDEFCSAAPKRRVEEDPYRQQNNLYRGVPHAHEERVQHAREVEHVQERLDVSRSKSFVRRVQEIHDLSVSREDDGREDERRPKDHQYREISDDHSRDVECRVGNYETRVEDEFGRETTHGESRANDDRVIVRSLSFR